MFECEWCEALPNWFVYERSWRALHHRPNRRGHCDKSHQPTGYQLPTKSYEKDAAAWLHLGGVFRCTCLAGTRSKGSDRTVVPSSSVSSSTLSALASCPVRKRGC